jgi:hypothetical protein
VILRLSRAARNEIGPQPLPFAAKSSGLSASPACNLLLRAHRGIPRTAVVAKATTLAAGRIECGINLDIPTEAVVTVNPLIGAPRRRSVHLNFNDRRNSMMHSAIDIHALTTMLAHSNQILPFNNYHQPVRINSLVSVHSIPSQPLFSCKTLLAESGIE